MVEGARLEIVYTVTPYRGFESPPLRQRRKAHPCGGLLSSLEGGIEASRLGSVVGWIFVDAYAKIKV